MEGESHLLMTLSFLQTGKRKMWASLIGSLLPTRTQTLKYKGVSMLGSEYPAGGAPPLLPA